MACRNPGRSVPCLPLQNALVASRSQVRKYKKKHDLRGETHLCSPVRHACHSARMFSPRRVPALPLGLVASSSSSSTSPGLEIDEIMDLWGLIFPKHRNVWYDEEEEHIHYNEETEAVSAE
jgi:hypothetical protein